MRTLVIAEPGCTAEGDLDRMLSLVEMTATAGADIFKAQWTSDPVKMCARRNAADYLPYYQWLRWPERWHHRLALECNNLGIGYACSVYLPEDVEVIDPYVWLYKLAAFEATDIEMYKAYAGLMLHNNKELVVSLGMGAGFPYELLPESLWPRVRPLRCVSAYPTPVEQLGLGLIRTHQLAGFSDHAAPHVTWTGALAVQVGAEIVERHIRLESCWKGNPDFATAMGMHGFVDYVRQIREAERGLWAAPEYVEYERAMGETAGVQPAETPMMAYRVAQQ